MVEDNDIRTRMPWLFGGEKWVNKPSGWGHPYACIENAQCHQIANAVRTGKSTRSAIIEHWGIDNKVLNAILRDF